MNKIGKCPEKDMILALCMIYMNTNHAVLVIGLSCFSLKSASGCPYMITKSKQFVTNNLIIKEKHGRQKTSV